MLVRFEDIPDTGLALTITGAGFDLDGETNRCCDLDCPVFLERRDDRVFLRGRLRVRLILACDRCLESFTLPFDGEFVMEFLLVADGGRQFASDYLCGPDELDLVFLEQPVIDLDDVVREQVFLILPEKRLCRDGCAGLCPGCGADLNQGACACGGIGAASPFAALARLQPKRK